MAIKNAAVLLLAIGCSLASPNGYHQHATSFGSSYAYGDQSFGASNGAPVVKTKLTYNGCSSGTGCGGVTLEDGKVTHQYGNPAAIGVNVAPESLEASELHKKFVAQASDVNSAFSGNLPADGPFWWANENSPFKNAHEAYMKWLKEGVNGVQVNLPCGLCAANNNNQIGHDQKTVPEGVFNTNSIDISQNPFLNGQFAAGFSQANVGVPPSGNAGFPPTSNAGPSKVDISQNPFLNGNINMGVPGGFEAPKQPSTASQGFNGNPFLNRPSGGCNGAGSQAGGCRPSGFVHQTGTVTLPDSKPQEVPIPGVFTSTGCSPGTPGCSSGVIYQSGSVSQQPASGCAGGPPGSCDYPEQSQVNEPFPDQQQQQQPGCSGPFCGLDQQTQKPFPKPVTNLPHPAGSTAGGFRGETTGSGELTITCSGPGKVCVEKYLCNNGYVNDDGENILQARGVVQCKTSSEVCCKLKPKPVAPLSPSSNQVDSTSLQSSLSSNVVLSSGNPVAGSQSSTGLTFIPGSDDQRSVGFNQQPFGPGSALKPGIPYLPPVEEPLSRPPPPPPPTQPPTRATPPPTRPPPPPPPPTNPPTPPPTRPTPPPTRATPPPYVPPKQTPPPYVPPKQTPPPYVPPKQTPPPYVPPKQTPPPYLPPKTNPPPYLPPKEDETPQSSSGSQQIVPGPNDSEGTLLLDNTRNPPPPPPRVVPIIPSGCAAALKCTPIEYCTAEGVISNTTVILTKQQEEYRVPMTDCKDDNGNLGKCCRDSTYKDPWPTNQLGQWVPGAFGDTGAYRGDNYRSSQNPGRPNGTQRNNGFNPGARPEGSINRPIFTNLPTKTSSSNFNPKNPVKQTNKFAPPQRQPQPTPEQYSTGQLQLSNFNQGSCGVRQPGLPAGNKNQFEADFGEIPWQAMILLETNRSLLCGGVITAPDAVVTSAHCIDGLEPKNVLIKGGEWKLGVDEEPKPFQIVQVKKIIKHPGYQPGNLQNDLAILMLEEKLRYASNIGQICVPPSSQSQQSIFNKQTQCITTGWGKKVLQVNIPNAIMHTMDMNILQPNQCQAQISQNYPHLLEQYNQNNCICGQPVVANANVCKVDIGSALACTGPGGSYYIEGVYSWDSGCNSPNQIASFFKFDATWYENAMDGAKSQSNFETFENSQIYKRGYEQIGTIAQPSQVHSYAVAGFGAQDHSYAASNREVFHQAVGHVHTGPDCHCTPNGK